jgi:hypothetical protein
METATLQWSLDAPTAQASLNIPAAISLAEFDELADVIRLQLRTMRRTLELRERRTATPAEKKT